MDSVVETKRRLHAVEIQRRKVIEESVRLSCAIVFEVFLSRILIVVALDFNYLIFVCMFAFWIVSFFRRITNSLFRVVVLVVS